MAEANKNGSDIARMLIVDLGVKEKWGELFKVQEKKILKGEGMSLNSFMTMQKLTVEGCEGKLFDWLFCAHI
jgi:hypothetical protein